jgi:ethanolamine ammonia-lyase small subunit
LALGRTGASLPTAEVLGFAMAHALARDAVHAALDETALRARLAALGPPVLAAASAAPSRAAYLRRPDLGRRLAPESRAVLEAAGAGPVDLALVVADGLSATAVHTQVPPFLEALLPRIRRSGWSLAPVVLAVQARVALGDEIGAILRARAVAVLIGERPGLSSPDSLGVYMTHGPRVGRTDAERNCISNVRPEGLGHGEAAFRLHWLLEQAFLRGLSGVSLKDESDRAALDAPEAPRLAD